MYSSLKQRWKSSIDLSNSSNNRSSDDDLSPGSSSSTVQRSAGRVVSEDSNNNSSSSSSSNSKGGMTLKRRIRAYLSDDARQKLEVGYGSSEANSSSAEDAPRTSTSNSFVKRLVATLERRQRDGAGVFGSMENLAGYSSKEYKAFCKEERSGFASRMQQPRAVQQCRDEDGRNVRVRYDPTKIVSPTTSRKLSKVYEEDHEELDDDDDEEEDYSTNEDDCFSTTDTDCNSSSYWDSNTNVSAVPQQQQQDNDALQQQQQQQQQQATLQPSDNTNKPATVVRKTIRSVLSSLKSWHSLINVNKSSSRSLPKGSRDYYAARESLGEEMRAFRQNTMPKLMERAAGRLEVSEADERMEFSKLIGTPRSSAGDVAARGTHPATCATIHPIYGKQLSSSVGASGTSEDEHICHGIEDRREIVYAAARKPQPTPAPVAPATSPLSPAAARVDHRHQLSDECRELQRKLNHELDMIANAALRFRPTKSSAAAVYDVPKLVVTPELMPRRPPIYDEARIVVRSNGTSPIYENVSDAGASGDERLRCTEFTTF